MALGVAQEEIVAKLEELDAMAEDERQQYTQDRIGQLSEGVLVEQVEECMKESTMATRARREMNKQLWNAYQNEMAEYATKDAWQAKIVVNDPFTACYQAKALVRKAVSDRNDYFDVQPPPERKNDPLAMMKAKFWKDAMRYWTREAGFTPMFPDMTEMGFVLGLSLGAKVLWEEDEHGRSHLKFMRIKPWNLYYDPDREPRESQGGLYCIHEEWLDYHLLLEGQKNGLYQNVENVLREDAMDDGTGQYQADQYHGERRRDGFYNRHSFRRAVLVREFYGDLLNHNGELVASKVRMVVANRTVIMPPTPFPLPTLRWPIHQFAPIPHMTKFHGISLVEGVLKIWKLRNNLLSLMTDNLNFTLNKSYEVDPNKLVDPADTEVFPGAIKRRKTNQQGPAYMEIAHDNNLGEVSAIWALTDQQFQRGCFVTELIRGDIGSRRATAREVEIKTQQATGVFDSIGRDVEHGGVGLLKMIQEILATLWEPTDHPSHGGIVEANAKYLEIWQFLSQEERAESVAMETDITVKGVSAILERANFIQRIRDAIEVSTVDPELAMYVDKQKVVKKYYEALDMADALRPEEEIKAMQAQQGAGELPPGPGGLAPQPPQAPIGQPAPPETGGF